MKRVGFLLKVKPEKIIEYKARHQVVWPEMLSALRRAGWRNYSLYLREMDCSLAILKRQRVFRPRSTAWQKKRSTPGGKSIWRPFFENLTGAHADQSM